MTKLYKIINPENNNTKSFSDNALLKTIKVVDNRSKELYEYYVEMWENLEGKKFRREILKEVL